MARGEALLERVANLGGGARLPGAQRHAHRQRSDAAGEEATVPVQAALHAEILEIIAGGMPRTQAYPQAQQGT